MNKASKLYYKNIKVLIPLKGKYEKKLLKGYKERILELNEIHTDVTYQKLEENLGTPADVIDNYYGNVDTTYLIKKLRVTNLFRVCIYCILILALMLFTLSAGLNIKLYHDVENAIVTHEETIID